MDTRRRLLHHVLATLAYRTRKAIDNAPPGFAHFDAGGGARTPIALLRHMTDLLRGTRTLFVDADDLPLPEGPWEVEVRRFEEALRALSLELPAAPLRSRPGARVTAEQVLQGPLCDAMTHAGQLALLRRLAGAPVAAENFMQADVHRALRRIRAPVG